MRQPLAERLLAEVMHWNPARVAEERPILQALADYKYDGYQQFSTGMHFIESLAIWLNNFNEPSERQTAYDFVKTRLVFVSEAEMRHLVGLSYRDAIRGVLLSRAAAEISVPEYRVSKVLSSTEFNRAERKSVFLGLSDGARIDVFRRMAGLSNEQVHATYQLSDEKAQDMVRELRSDLHSFGTDCAEECFNSLFLLDDFSGSGDSLLTKDGKKGKILRCIRTLVDNNEATQLLDLSTLSTYVVLYLATQRAVNALEERLASVWPSDLPHVTVLPVHVLSASVVIGLDGDFDFDQMLVKYYDKAIMDKHLLKGGRDVIHGYARCSLPLVLAHNTPNNSVYLLWASKQGLRTRALFPRVSRHRDEA